MLPVPPQRVVGRRRHGGGHGYVVHNGAVPDAPHRERQHALGGREDAPLDMQQVQRNKEDDCKVPPTLITCAQDDLWPVNERQRQQPAHVR